MIDLHTHTTASDGQYTPAELIRKVAGKISVLAITDHDTVAGLEEGKKAAQECDITFVPGIELNINRPGCEFHLLGLGLKNPSKSLNDVIQKLIDSREERNQYVINKMLSEGIQVSLEQVQNDFPGQVLGRPHFAQWLEEHKIGKNRQQAFDKYLAQGRKYFVQRAGTNLDEAIMAIRDSGGVPVLAHPTLYHLGKEQLDILVSTLKSKGLAYQTQG